MEVSIYNTKGVMIMYPLAVLFGIMLILLNGYCCGAAVLVETNTTFRCDGRLDECLLEDDLQLEFLMNPYVSRQLAPVDPLPNLSPGNEANNQNLPVFRACGGYNPRNRAQDIYNYHVCVAKFINDNKKCKVENIYAARDCTTS